MRKKTSGRPLFTTRFLTQAALIAALYAALTIWLAPISFDVHQVRVAEALTILPAFTPAAIPGLFLGCVLANTVSFLGLPDLIFGSLATLVSAFLTHAIANAGFWGDSMGFGGGSSAAPDLSGAGVGPSGAAGGSSRPTSMTGLRERLFAKPALRVALLPLPPVLINMAVIGLLLSLFYAMPFGAAAVSVLIGQSVSCYGLGLPLYMLLLAPARRKVFSL
ncbi:MAG: QueT transporter family protein [Clostridiales bacterium]|jgi:uncharacterized membrane protein|nr:QueT transporter family protein [Clostridiales bacterium]